MRKHERELSPRQHQILLLIAQGIRNRDIAKRLGISPNTVRNHVVDIFDKLGVRDRTQAALLAYRQGYVG